jgi:hypothetical protein
LLCFPSFFDIFICKNADFPHFSTFLYVKTPIFRHFYVKSPKFVIFALISHDFICNFRSYDAEEARRVRTTRHNRVKFRAFFDGKNGIFEGFLMGKWVFLMRKWRF